MIKELKFWSLVTARKPESHSYFLHCVCPPHGVMHHHYEFHEVNLSIVIHVNRSHQRIDLGLGWIVAQSSEESPQLFRANITVLVLKHKTDAVSRQMYWREILCRINGKPLSSLRQNPGRYTELTTWRRDFQTPLLTNDLPARAQ